MRRAKRLTALWLAAFTISPTLLTACADDDASTDDDDNNSPDDDDTTSDDDDDDVTGDDDDVTDDDDDLLFCETIATQSDCEARKDCFAFIEYTWWYLDAASEQCRGKTLCSLIAGHEVLAVHYNGAGCFRCQAAAWRSLLRSHRRLMCRIGFVDWIHQRPSVSAAAEGTGDDDEVVSFTARAQPRALPRCNRADLAYGMR